MKFELFAAKCEEKLKDFQSNYFGSCVCDPPYELGFMGKEWDKTGIAYSVDMWKEVLRVLKPGAHLLAFGGTRTSHRMVCAIEDAGFEIRDSIQWIYGSGFPKSHNLDGDWEGYGTALKPAHEPICMARKPLEKGLTIAENVKKWGTGAINIDGCRIEGKPWKFGTQTNIKGGDFGHRNTDFFTRGEPYAKNVEGGENGRWPANVIHDGSEEVVALFPESKGQQGDVKGTEPSNTGGEGTNCFGKFNRVASRPKRNDEGSAARFFYVPKTSRADRNEGCEQMDKKPMLWSSGTKSPGTFQSAGTDRSSQNNHPTVKPTELMRYLVRLVTPPKEICLDQVCGSGSTGKGCALEGIDFVGIDQDALNIEIANCRIQYILDNMDMFGNFNRIK